MKSPLTEPGLYTVPGGWLSLSGPALKEFLRAVLAKGAAFRFQARGFSMHPFIQDGDVITVSSWRSVRLCPGDVVAFCRPDTGKFMVHRILAGNSRGYLLKGDNCSETDGLIPPGDILGRVTKVERNGRVLRLGWGPERRLLALLARHQLLQPVVFRTWQALRPYIRRNLA